LENFATIGAIGSNVSGDKAGTLEHWLLLAVIAHQDQKLADYIDDYYYQILYPPVLEQMRDYSSDNRTKFDFVVARGLAELADEDEWEGLLQDQVLLLERTDHVWNIQRRKRSKKMGRDTCKQLGRT
jgi:hypothetical protein